MAEVTNRNNVILVGIISQPLTPLIRQGLPRDVQNESFVPTSYVKYFD